MKLINIEDEILLKNLSNGGLSAKQVTNLFMKQPIIEAIPIEWIEEWLKNMPKHTTPYFYKSFLRNAIRVMVKDWRKENEK